MENTSDDKEVKNPGVPYGDDVGNNKGFRFCFGIIEFFY